MKAYVSCAGAGISLVRDLWAVPGASEHFIGASVPYAKEETDRVLGYVPEKYVSEDTALGLAVASYLRAVPHSDDPVGVGITATIAGTRIHRGDHVIHAAAVHKDRTVVARSTLFKDIGEYARLKDEQSASWLGGDVLYNAHLHKDQEEALRKHVLQRPLFLKGGQRRRGAIGDLVFLSGNFNPIHVGHRTMANIVAQSTDERVVYELCLTPPHKPRIPVPEALRRVALVDRDIVVTETPLYLDKARRWPGCGFIVGSDALTRLLDPQWGPVVDEMCDEFERLGTRFYVFDRVGHPWWTTDRPNLFISMPGTWNISSTELRKQQ